MAELSHPVTCPFPIPAPSPNSRAKGGRLRYSDQPQTFSRIETLQQRALEYSKATRAALTNDAYRRDWKAFTEWCDIYGLAPLPAEDATLAAFWTWCVSDGQFRISTSNRRICAIRHRHSLADLPDPVGPLTRAARRGATRVLKQRPRPKAALSVELLRQVARRLMEDGRPRSIHDRALLVLGFAAGFRRSNLHQLGVNELEFLEQGLVVHERCSKTDQEGKGRDIAIFRGLNPATDPVAAVGDWLQVRGTWPGPVFVAFHPNTNERFYQRPLGDHEAVTRILKRALKQIGLPPEEIRRYSSHSLRAGMVTCAAEAGASDLEIMQRSGHKTHTVMRKYVRSERLFIRDPLRQSL